MANDAQQEGLEGVLYDLLACLLGASENTRFRLIVQQQRNGSLTHQVIIKNTFIKSKEGDCCCVVMMGCRLFRMMIDVMGDDCEDRRGRQR